MTIKKLRDENEDLKMIILDVMWMAFRYVDGRSTYAPAMFNLAVHKLDSLGLSHLYAGDTAANRRFAKDGMFGEWNPELKTFVKEVGEIEQ
jgi:hypothetical protein